MIEFGIYYIPKDEIGYFHTNENPESEYPFSIILHSKRNVQFNLNFKNEAMRNEALSRIRKEFEQESRNNTYDCFYQIQRQLNRIENRQQKIIRMLKNGE